ncbi:MAG: hypothetical protein IT423_05355 [Pirellulaceae bacterium]|nr:hypothetical protein [Pirellulaceae bacterium]
MNHAAFVRALFTRPMALLSRLFLCMFLVAPQALSTLAAQDTDSKPAGEKPAGVKYSDDKYDFSLTVGAPWKQARLADYTVPGVARAAYSASEGASLVVFVQEPGKAYEPRFLVDESAKAMEKSLGGTIRAKEVKSVANKQAMWMIVEGKGNGGAIDGQGAITTTQHWVGIPREKDIIVCLLTSPTSKFEENEKSFAAILKAMTVGGKQTAEQTQSK